MSDKWIPIEWMRDEDIGTDMNAGPSVRVSLMHSPFYDGERFAVRRGASCLNTNGAWEYEPTPSSRDDAFYERCRFQTFDDAIATADSEEAKT